MLFKTARAPIKTHHLFPAKVATDVMAKTASLHSIVVNPDYYYLDNWAVSAFEVFGLNDNADGFEHEELEKSYKTFIGSWTCLDHNNDREELSVGRQVDAVYTPEKYVRVVMAVNRKKGEVRHPGLEQKIATGTITDTSMGALCRESVCTVPKCANVATDETQYCRHVRELRGQKLCNAETDYLPVVVGELNRGVVFFEDSIITTAEGADPNAKIHQVLAQAQTGLRSLSPDKLYHLIKEMSKTASQAEKAMLVTFLEQLDRIV
jgi:hypothetical protein